MSDGASNRIPFISRFNALPVRVRMLCVSLWCRIVACLMMWRDQNTCAIYLTKSNSPQRPPPPLPPPHPASHLEPAWECQPNNTKWNRNTYSLTAHKFTDSQTKRSDGVCVCLVCSTWLRVISFFFFFFFSSSFSTAYSLCHQESSTLFLPAFIFRIYCAIENRIALPAAELRKHIEINAGETTPRAPLSTAQCTRFERIIFLDIPWVYVRLWMYGPSGVYRHTRFTTRKSSRRIHTCQVKYGDRKGQGR